MVLELNDIRMSYAGAGKEAIRLLDGVDLSVGKKTVTALIGGNGAGKTTLFNIISGFEKGFRGTVVFNGRDITRLSASSISRLGIGRLFQGRQLMGDLTLMENLLLGSFESTFEWPLASILARRRIRREEAGKRQKAIDLLSTLFGPENKYLGMLESKASELSYGEQRLMAITRLLMGENDLLLLDEPTSGINPKYIEVFRDVIRRIVEEGGRTVLMIEHNMSFVRSVADRCNYLADGRIIQSGTAADILDNPTIRQDYLGL